MRPAEVDHLVGDASKAREVLGWKPRVGFRRAGRPHGRRRHRGGEDRLVTRPPSSPASPARTAATSPSGWWPTASRCTHWCCRTSQRAAVPGACVLMPATCAMSRALASLLLDLAPDEIYNLAAISSVAQSWEWPDLAALVNGSAAVALLESAFRVQEKAGHRVSFVQASSAEMFGQPTVVSPGRDHPAAPAQPVRRRQGLRPPHGRRLPDPRTARVEPGSVQPRVAAATRTASSPARSPRPSPRSRGQADRLALGNLDARRDWGWAPDYVDAMVRAARADTAADYMIATGSAHSVRDFVRAAFARVGSPTGTHLVTLTPPSCGPPTPPSSSATPAALGHSSGGRRRSTFAELVGRMVEADLVRSLEPAHQRRRALAAGSRRSRSCAGPRRARGAGRRR